MLWAVAIANPSQKGLAAMLKLNFLELFNI